MQQRILDKTRRTYDRLSFVLSFPAGAVALDLLLGHTPPGVEPPSSRLRVDRCDLLDTSAGVDPLTDLNERHRETISSEKFMFPDPPQGMDNYGAVNRKDISEYAESVRRQRRSNEVVLSDCAVAGGNAFAFGKPTGAQREVWHGTRVSETVARPPSRRDSCY